MSTENKPRYTLGTKTKHGTFNANMLFYGKTVVAQMSGVLCNRTYEEMEQETPPHFKVPWDKAKALVAKLNAFDAMVGALKQLSTCNLTEENCASFDVANRRIRNISSAALAAAKEVQCN